MALMETENQKNYEISFLVRGEEAAGSVVKHLNRLGAEISGEGSIGAIKLAYPIKKHETAHFGYIHFNAVPGLIADLKEALKFEEGILRYLIVTPAFVKDDLISQKKTKYEDTKTTAREREGIASNEDLEARLEEISESLE